jgi:signal transduction histidine kinase
MDRTRALALVGITLVGAAVVDYLATWPYIMTPLYAIPVLVAAYCLPPRGAVATAALAVTINLASGLLEHTPVEVVLLYTSGLLISAFLAVALARQRQASARHAQAAEQHAQAAELARQRLQVFLGMVAHDLRNPLSAILGAAQMLDRPAAQALPPRQGQMLLLIATAAQTMDRLLADLRDASTIGAGHFAIRRAPADLVAIARQVVALQEASADGHRLILDAPVRLEGAWDGERLNQLLTNLISNAIKYSPAGGVVRVSVHESQGEARVSVADQGIGIGADETAKLFQPFARLYEGQDVPGVGLGLFISKAIVEAHGGRIWVESAPGQGSVFSVALPRVEWPFALPAALNSA